MDIIYSDISKNFESHPFTHDIAQAINIQAVKNSLLALLLTNKGERLYQPDVGGNISQLLFENSDITTLHQTELAIQSIIDNGDEPRVIIEDVIVHANDTQNEYVIKILFYIINDLENLQELKTTIKSEQNDY